MKDFKAIGLPIVFIAGLTFLGIIMDRLLRSKLIKLAERTRWKGDEIILNSIKNMMVLWGFLAGLLISLKLIPIKPALAESLHKLISVIIVFSFVVVSARIAAGFTKIYTEKVKEILPRTSIFENLTKILIYLLGFLIILQMLGVSITPLLTALGVGGIAVALALQDTLSNLFSGLHILLSRQIKPGDYVKLETGEEGYVIDITWRNTTIRQLTNNMIIVPNAKLSSAIITNYHLPDRELLLLIPVGVSYDSNLEKVERVTVEVAREVMREVPGGVPYFEPFIRYSSFGDFSINFTVVLRVREFADQYLIRHEFIKRLHKRYREEGIVIPFPIRRVYIQRVDETSQTT